MTILKRFVVPSYLNQSIELDTNLCTHREVAFAQYIFLKCTQLVKWNFSPICKSFPGSKTRCLFFPPKIIKNYSSFKQIEKLNTFHFFSCFYAFYIWIYTILHLSILTCIDWKFSIDFCRYVPTKEIGYLLRKCHLIWVYRDTPQKIR